MASYGVQLLIYTTELDNLRHDLSDGRPDAARGPGPAGKRRNRTRSRESAGDARSDRGQPLPGSTWPRPCRVTLGGDSDATGPACVGNLGSVQRVVLGEQFVVLGDDGSVFQDVPPAGLSSDRPLL